MQRVRARRALLALGIVVGCSSKAAPVEPAPTVRPTSLVRCEVRCQEPGSVQWLTQTPGAASAGGVAVHSDGTIVAAGTFAGTVTFGEATLQSKSDDVFVAKYDRHGAPIWARHLGGPGMASGVALAADGDVLVAGNFGRRTGFVARYDANGEPRWTTSFTAEELRVRGVAVTSDGNAVATGSFLGSAHLREGIDLHAAGDGDVFVLSIDPRGVMAWARSAGGTEGDSGSAVAALSDGAAVVTGYFEADATFADGHTLRSAGALDGFVVTYDASGVLRSLEQLPGEGIDSGHGVATSREAIFVTGTSAAPEAGQLGSPNHYDMFVAKLGTDTPWRERSLHGDDMDRGLGIAVTPERTAVSGEFMKTLTFGDRMIYAPRGRNLYFASFDADRTPLWALRAGPVEHAERSGIALQRDGAVVLVGTAKADATLGERSLAAGYFLAALAP